MASDLRVGILGPLELRVGFGEPVAPAANARFAGAAIARAVELLAALARAEGDPSARRPCSAAALRGIGDEALMAEVTSSAGTPAGPAGRTPP